MLLSVTRPQLDDVFIERLDRGTLKGAEATIVQKTDTFVRIVVKASGRVLAKLRFSLQGDYAELTEKLIIEREFFPLEVAVERLIRYLKRRRPKHILYN